MIGREDEVRVYRDRVRYLLAVVVAFLSLILIRLVYLQLIKGEELRKFSEANRLKKERLVATRGVVYDRSGKVIVDNRASFDVVLLSQYYPFSEAVDKKLASILQMPEDELEKKLQKAKRSPTFYPTLLKSDVSKDIVAALEMNAENVPGVDIEVTVQRRYPYSSVGAQLLGYVGEVSPAELKRDYKKQLQMGDYIGKVGLEKDFDPYLRGESGVGYVEVDARGRRRTPEGAERLLGYFSQTDPVPGYNVYLSLDIDLETAAANAMQSRELDGAVIALDPRNGEVLALYNSPTYDPSAISGREVDPGVWRDLAENVARPLRNRVIQDHYPPGSTFKPLVAIAALAEGLATRTTSVNCTGGMNFGGRRFACWQRHGAVDFVRSIKESCDIFYYTMGNQLGVDRIAKYARLFGLGAPTRIGLSGETRGLVPDTAWKKERFNDIWHPGETLSVAIGQGAVDATPVQLASAYAAIANGGFLYRPLLVRRIEGRQGETIKEFAPELVRKIELPEGTLDLVKEGLFKVINEPGGTAALSKTKKTILSGKTGTAQVKTFSDITTRDCAARPYLDRHHALFVGYAPMENPEIAVAVVAEHGCHGWVAARVVKEIVEAYMDKHGPQEVAPLVTTVSGGANRMPASEAKPTPVPASALDLVRKLPIVPQKKAKTGRPKVVDPVPTYPVGD